MMNNVMYQEYTTTAQWQEMDELTLSVLCNLTLQVNLFSGKIIYWLPQFTQKYHGMFISILSGRCDRSKCECLITRY